MTTSFVILPACPRAATQVAVRGGDPFVERNRGRAGDHRNCQDDLRVVAGQNVNCQPV